MAALILALLWPQLTALLLQLTNNAVVPQGWSLSLWRFHMGVLTNEHIRRAEEAKLIRSEIDHFKPTGAVLKNGQEIECDYVVCATGFRSGAMDIVYEVDNHVIQFQPIESLFEGVCSPVMPRMIFANALAYDFGIKRATALADHVMSLLVRYPDASRIKNTYWNSRSSNLNSSLLFDTSKSMVKVFLTGWLMLIYVGVLSIGSLLSHMIGIFLLTRLRTLQLKHPQAHRW